MRDEHHANGTYGLKELNAALPRPIGAFPAPLPGLPAEFSTTGDLALVPCRCPTDIAGADLRNRPYTEILEDVTKKRSSGWRPAK